MAADITTQSLSVRRSRPKTIAGAQKIIDRLERQVIDLNSLRGYVQERRDELSVENDRLSRLVSERYEQIQGLRRELTGLYERTTGPRAAIVHAIRQAHVEFDQTFEFNDKETARQPYRVINTLLDALEQTSRGAYPDANQWPTNGYADAPLTPVSEQCDIEAKLKPLYR